MVREKEFDLGQRIQALTLHSEGYSRKAITERTGYTPSGLSYLITTAKKRGYKPGEGLILLQYVENEPGRGRKPVLTDASKRRIIEILTADEASHKLSLQKLADKFNETNAEDHISISRSIVARFLEEEGFKKVKYTYH
ncbi:hypothetical protein O1611_g5290 [Lasiodiplodia mahajangana]|uniref:Uncharacterized protein n=1 Tax=Lasiodiplodia mahajangana TaxID=1108764 RepID=A0ACC2JLG6_9PEZI|nr:hypothetical protein O1611_g5290 [Lasiodiplodia mahajangana]